MRQINDILTLIVRFQLQRSVTRKESFGDEVAKLIYFPKDTPEAAVVSCGCSQRKPLIANSAQPVSGFHHFLQPQLLFQEIQFQPRPQCGNLMDTSHERVQGFTWVKSGLKEFVMYRGVQRVQKV